MDTLKVIAKGVLSTPYYFLIAALITFFIFFPLIAIVSQSVYGVDFVGVGADFLRYTFNALNQ